MNQVVSFGIITVLFALMYRILPSVSVGWNDVWIGAAATALLFTVGKFAIGVYLGKAGVTSGFGAAGSIVVLLVWVYYSSQTLSPGRGVHLGVRAQPRLARGGVPTADRCHSH